MAYSVQKRKQGAHQRQLSLYGGCTIQSSYDAWSMRQRDLRLPSQPNSTVTALWSFSISLMVEGSVGLSGWLHKLPLHFAGNDVTKIVLYTICVTVNIVQCTLP